MLPRPPGTARRQTFCHLRGLAAIGLLSTKDLAALAIENAKSDRARRPRDIRSGDDRGGGVRRFNLDFLQNRRRVVGRRAQNWILNGCDFAARVRWFSTGLTSERGARGGEAPNLRFGLKSASVAIVAPESASMRIPAPLATASATWLQYLAVASELASSSRRRAAEYASAPRLRISASASASILSALSRLLRGQNSISYAHCAIEVTMLRFWPTRQGGHTRRSPAPSRCSC